MAKRATIYLVAYRAKSGPHYVLATIRRFYSYTEAEQHMLSLDVSREPIVLMFD